MSDIVTINGLSKKFGKKIVFDNLSLSFPAGRVIGLLGENGIGKTTLLRMIADILKPTCGEILLNGSRVCRHTRENVSFMLSPDNFFYFMRVKDAVQYFSDFYADFDAARAFALCDEFGLDLKARIKKMSKGQQERLCILLCLCRRVPLYLLDEPIAGLDPKFKHESIKAMLSGVDGEQTIIISSHLLRDLETVFDEVFILKTDAVVRADCDDIRARGQSVEAFYLEVAGGGGEK